MIQTIDWQIFSAIEKLQCPFLDWLFPWLTQLGNAGIFWIVAAVICLLIPGYRRCGYAMAIALIFVLLLGNCCLKPLIARARPFHLDPGIQLLITAPTDYSFPSGHTYSSIASAIILWHRDKRLGIPAMILAILIAFSRLYLKVHFFTDILAGILMGIFASWIGIKLGYKQWKKEL